MGTLDFGKITTIILIFFIISFFFGDKLLFWYEHKDDMQFELSTMVYTKKDFEAMQEQDQKGLLSEISSICVRKHHIDGLDCTDTAYWLANSLEEKGIDGDLAIDWMEVCSESCQTGKYEAPVLKEENKAGYSTSKKPAEKSQGTKWFWEKN